MIVDRIRQIIDYKHICVRKFCIEIGVSNGFLDKVKDVGVEKVVKILNTYPEINPEWLVTGKGEMLRSDNNKVMQIENNSIQRFKYKTDIPASSVRVPLYNVEAVAGIVEVFDQITNTEPIAYLEIPNLPNCDGAIYMVGDSMYPLLKSGDIIIYKVLNNLQNILWGEMYLLSLVHDGDAFITVKYVKQSNTPNHVTLISYNEHHQPKDFPIDAIKFAGLIKASVRINCMG